MKQQLNNRNIYAIYRQTEILVCSFFRLRLWWKGFSLVASKHCISITSKNKTIKHTETLRMYEQSHTIGERANKEKKKERLGLQQSSPAAQEKKWLERLYEHTSVSVSEHLSGSCVLLFLLCYPSHLRDKNRHHHSQSDSYTATFKQHIHFITRKSKSADMKLTYPPYMHLSDVNDRPQSFKTCKNIDFLFWKSQLPHVHR